MSMRPGPLGEVPPDTVRVARAAFPQGSLAIRIRDELGVLFTDEQFAALFSARGRPAWSPGRLAMVLVLQFVEGLTDRHAAQAVRARIDWKYGLGLELTDPGFNFSVLSEFRDRLLTADAGRGIFERILDVARERGLLVGGGRARTDSTHVLSSARELSWLELVGESLRAALNAVVRAQPAWLDEWIPVDWLTRYAARIEDSRLPKSRAGRDEAGLRIGADGLRLLRRVWDRDAPAALRALPAVQVLRQVWVQQFHLVQDVVQRRDPKNLPPGAKRLVTPYDVEARGSVKREMIWDGYKVHFTETCEPDAVHLITNVTSTVATVSDDRMAAVVHTALAERGLLPDEHWVDTGYANAGALVAAHRDHQVALHGPMRPVTVAQSRGDGAFGQSAFAIDWDNQHVTCPNGATSTRWKQRRSEERLEVIRVRFSPADCRPCP